MVSVGGPEYMLSAGGPVTVCMVSVGGPEYMLSTGGPVWLYVWCLWEDLSACCLLEDLCDCVYGVCGRTWVHAVYWRTCVTVCMVSVGEPVWLYAWCLWEDLSTCCVLEDMCDCMYGVMVSAGGSVWLYNYMVSWCLREDMCDYVWCHGVCGRTCVTMYGVMVSAGGHVWLHNYMVSWCLPEDMCDCMYGVMVSAGGPVWLCVWCSKGAVWNLLPQ